MLFVGLINMLCLFGKKAVSDLHISLNWNPFFCDCLDFEIYATSKRFQRISVLDDLFCADPLDLLGERVSLK